ncbi:MAG: heterodisulfide reductase-related iron-sulfur binding cluster [Gammaproteobacteria bacterium]|nr:heterodisulfide reductase-related iron-sulfur binding cluster [Gammaproteobacteria bacterium]
MQRTIGGQMREGSLEAPTRHPVDWQSDEYFDESALFQELERVFDICHGCRRCFNLCNAFPTLFDAVDESSSGELDSVPKNAYWDVVDECYLCDMCYMSKCPYVPPHEWNVDFPHLMLRAKAKRFRDEGASVADKLLADTDRVGTLAGIPVVAEIINTVNSSAVGRVVLEKTLGVDRSAPVPTYHRNSARQRLRKDANTASLTADRQSIEPLDGIQGRVVLFTTCYGNRNTPEICEDLVAVFEHNGIAVELAKLERCCGMPKLELGDLDGVARSKEENISELVGWVRDGWDIVAPIPSCVLMFKQELPLLFPDDAAVLDVGNAFFDPFEYLAVLQKGGKFRTDFKNALGKVAYQVPCHLRVQNIGLKTKSILELVPDTSVEAIERCSGHDGTYGVKKRFREASLKIASPVMRRVEQCSADHFVSDCPMAGAQIAGGLEATTAQHPLTLLRRAYGL